MKSPFQLLLLALLATAACQQSDHQAATASTLETDHAVRERVAQLAKAYSHKDGSGFVGLTDPDGSVVYGTDSAEVNVGQAAILQQMQADFATVDSLHFGSVANYHSQATPALATAFFDQPLDAYVGGHRYHGLIRFATVWHKRDDGNWYLSQTLVSRPTKGKSSREVVAARHKQS
ncbi:YybH family protein [Hymenobacter sp. BT491]|uniref:YybH family protein n=1 Tax=Hymenobacter sp. BT491 TaxID=2766779 RepID=UPI0016534E25|nr:nuclear transport factor 2 family protein [Hymenobacter sp. BT491]MBC6988724.1 nuclear transport factor 2 family protein [Hymenobacter sp. BT491]